MGANSYTLVYFFFNIDKRFVVFFLAASFILAKRDRKKFYTLCQHFRKQGYTFLENETQEERPFLVFPTTSTGVWNMPPAFASFKYTLKIIACEYYSSRATTAIVITDDSGHALPVFYEASELFKFVPGKATAFFLPSTILRRVCMKDERISIELLTVVRSGANARIVNQPLVSWPAGEQLRKRKFHVHNDSITAVKRLFTQKGSGDDVRFGKL